MRRVVASPACPLDGEEAGPARHRRERERAAGTSRRDSVAWFDAEAVRLIAARPADRVALQTVNKSVKAVYPNQSGE